MQISTTDGITAVVAQEIARILDSETPAVDQDLFLAGGDSVRAVELITSLVTRYRDQTADHGDQLGAALLLAVFEDATPAALAAVVRAHLRQA